MKKINAIPSAIMVLLICLLYLIGCSPNENTPVGATSPSFSKPLLTNSIVLPLHATGLMYDRRLTNNVPVTTDSAIIALSFPVTMAGSYTVTLKSVSDNSVVPLTCTWDIGQNYSTLTIHPTANLEFQKRYWLAVSAASISDINGNRWDLDGDGVGGEAIDDDLEFYFNTQNGSGAAGVPIDSARFSVDRQGPALAGSLFCWKGSSQAGTTGVPVDISFYLRITDQKLLANRSNYDVAKAFQGTIDDSKIWLINSETKAKIAGAITFGNDPDAAYTISGSTVKVQPSSNLEPGKTYYVFVKQNAIKDGDGNKMGTFDGPGQDTVSFRITTSDTLLNGDTVKQDITAPSFVFTGASMLITFSELIDESTLNGTTIWYKDNTQVERHLTLSIVTEYTGTGKPVTVVHITPEAGHTTGTLLVNMREIRDLAGNYGAGINSSNTF